VKERLPDVDCLCSAQTISCEAGTSLERVRDCLLKHLQPLQLLLLSPINVI